MPRILAASVRVFPFLVLLVLPCTAFAGGAGDGAAGEGRLFNFSLPTGTSVSGSCSWIWQHNIGSEDDGSTQDSGIYWGYYAHARAQGQQIWGYAWAKTTSIPSDPWTHEEEGRHGQTIYVTYNHIPEGCLSKFKTDWDPTFKAAADVNEDAQAMAYGYMWGDTSATQLHARVHGGVHRVDDDGADVSFTHTGIDLPGTEAPGSFNCATSGDNPKEFKHPQPLSGLVGSPNELATFQCHCKVEVYADDDAIAYTYGEAQANIFASWPRLEIEAFCVRAEEQSGVTCSGGLTVVYGFPPP